MSPSDIKATFARFTSTDPVPSALRQILKERLVSATEDVARIDLNERAAGHSAGRIAELMDLQGQLAELLREPGKPE